MITAALLERLENAIKTARAEKDAAYHAALLDDKTALPDRSDCLYIKLLLTDYHKYSTQYRAQSCNMQRPPALLGTASLLSIFK